MGKVTTPKTAIPVVAHEEPMDEQSRLVVANAVLEGEQAWPMPMVCACCRGPEPCDWGLCCYVLWFGKCAAAEISEKIGARGLYGSTTCFEQFCAAYLTSLAVVCVGSFVHHVGAFLAPWVFTLFFAKIRHNFKGKFHLPDDELCCNKSCTSFLPIICICDCASCAVYQQAYFLKHRAGIDLECILYDTCCTCCALPVESGQQGDGYTATITQQPST